VASEVRVLAVDLAARFSAASVIHSPEPDKYEVIWQGDSSGALDESGRLRAVEVTPGSETRWVGLLDEMATRYVLYPFDEFVGAVAVEDVPFHSPQTSTLSHVYRLQLEAAIKLGYHPPEFGPSLVGRGTGTVRGFARKAQQDYVSSFLIGVWSCRILRERGNLTVPNSQQYVSAGSGVAVDLTEG
jgi:hypothetical protein